MAELLLHPKQDMVSLDGHRFKVVVAGRRWGKCLASGTLVSMADGREIPVESVKAGDLVLTVNQDTYALEPRQVQHLHNNGVRETVRVKTAARQIQCTPNHPLMINNGWVNAGDIQPGDLVAVPKHLAFGSKTIPDHELDYLAIWLAEGAKYTVSNTTPEILDILRDCAGKLGNLEMSSKDGINWTFYNGDRTGGSQAGTKNPARAMLERFGVWGLDSKTKIIPSVIFELTETQIARFLNLFFACDGNISKRSKNTWSLEMGLANEVMTRQLSSLLMKFGIRGAIRHKIHAAISKRSGKPFESWSYVASTPVAIQIFADRIGCVGKEQYLSSALACAAGSRGNCNSYLPVPYEDFVKHLRYESTEKGIYGGYNYSVARDLPSDLRESLNSWRKQSRKRISEYRFKALRDFSDGYFDPIADGDIAWEEVTSVELADTVQTWDLTVEGNHNFVAEGMITHNTRLALSELIKQAAGGPKRKVWYISPSYKMSKQIMWDDLIDSIPRRWIKKIHHTEMWIKLINRSVIELKGADNPDSLRGVGLFYVVLDEFQDIKPDTWKKVIRPTLAKDRGRALFIGTPKGYANLYDVYKLGQDKNKAQWASWQFPTITSPFIPVEEIEAARDDMDPKSFRQEFLASFESMSGRVYHAFDRNTHVGQYPFNPKLPIWVGQDFNVDPMSSAILQPQPNGDIWAVDEIVLRNSSTAETCDELERRFWRHTDAMTIYPDPAGGNRSSARGESDLDIFREKGFKRLKFKRKHPAVADRINSVNRQLMTASGRIRFYVNESCRETIKGLEETLYKSGSREVDKGPGVEHVIDGIGYCIDIERPMRKIEVMGVSI